MPAFVLGAVLLLQQFHVVLVEVDRLSVRKGRGVIPAFDVLCADGQTFVTMRKPDISRDIQCAPHGPATLELNSGRVIGIIR